MTATIPTTPTDLEALAASLWAANRFASSFAVNAGEDDPEPGAYVDISDLGDGTHAFELGDGSDAVSVHVDESFLAELHTKLTAALLAKRFRPAS
jgi:hypothetical protein